jgi:hypothetical protein
VYIGLVGIIQHIDIEYVKDVGRHKRSNIISPKEKLIGFLLDSICGSKKLKLT